MFNKTVILLYRLLLAVWGIKNREKERDFERGDYNPDCSFLLDMPVVRDGSLKFLL